MKKIIHVDMDCFYAAVEVKNKPYLKGKPLGIGGPPNSRSVLCTASYEARKFGVRAAMPSSHAVKLCKDLILIPPDFDSYRKESKSVRQILERFTDQIEPLSLDEAYLDVTDCKRLGGSATLIAQEIRRLIYTELNLTASAGVAPNKFLAKIASDWKKPNGQFVIKPEDIAAFVLPLPVEKIHGVGKVTAERMHKLGLHTCADIQNHSVIQLCKWFGSRGEDLYNQSRGIDHREVETSLERKSLTVEETYGKDIQTLDECLAKVPEIYSDWLRRLQKGSYQDRIKNIVVKLKFFDFKGTTHEEAIGHFPTEEDFGRLLEKAWSRRAAPVRLIGLGVHLVPAQPPVEKARDLAQLQFAM
ncbi:MAG: DNA polymerase IV [Bdellovibrio sp.]|nr:DNA polymerase IV [Bdellovibrio sp.]